MAGYLVYFNVKLKDDILQSPYNKRQDAMTAYVTRGAIISRDNNVLAFTETDELGQENRVYPYGAKYAHVVGYTARGKSGLEAVANYHLLTSNNDIVEHVMNDFLDKKNPGDNVITTLDSRLQDACYDALGDYRGAVLCMDPKTGQILSWVSDPDFDPNTIDQVWDEMVADETNSQLVNRGSQGRYSPGSVFKIVTALAYMRTHPDTSSFLFECQGEFTVEDQTVHCSHGNVHGLETFEEAFANSCNCAFAYMGLELGPEIIRETAESLLFNKKLPCDLNYNQSTFKLDSSSDTMALIQTAFGQGQTLASPYHMMLLTAAIANGGTLMKPHLVQAIYSADGREVKTYAPEVSTQLMTAEEAAKLKSMMMQVCDTGTASSLSDRGYDVAGKTGSAEFVRGDGSIGTHSWFTAILEPEDPKLIVTFLAEDGGLSSDTAVPAVGYIMDVYESIQG
ncbi:MAG: penicillin-binding protein 2 [Lachnospiraceae bacterium]|nr:penicillin-binding protein 2 [Candidatus Equihabitans merdae]